MVYLILLGVGVFGILAMGAFSFAHGAGHHGHTGGHAHAGGHGSHAGHTHAGHAGHSHGAHGHHDGGGDNPNADGDVNGNDLGAAAAFLWLMPYLSPLNWFAWCTGAGAAGSLATAMRIQEPFTACIALVGAVAFNRGLVRPIWNLVFQFASEPAGNLDNCLSQTVEAVTTFDVRGEGLVRVTIDGRTEDILARLSEAERSGPRVRKGDRLIIEEIFPHTNSCRVSRG